MTIKNTVNKEEIEKFIKIASQWWDPKGKFRPLHILNPIRLTYIKNTIINHFKSDNFKKISLLDIGCGGGLVSESLAKIGFNVTGIDAATENIEIAKNHAAATGVKLNYLTCTAEKMVAKDLKFDVVIALEVIEHVDDVEFFIECLAKLLKKDGLLIISTINKTIKSYLMAIIAAEYMMRMLPIGTHDYKKFLSPSQIATIAEKHHLKISDIKGLEFNPITNIWKLSAKCDVNYFIVFA